MGRHRKIPTWNSLEHYEANRSSMKTKRSAKNNAKVLQRSHAKQHDRTARERNQISASKGTRRSTENTVFPRVTPLVVFLLTSAIRVHYVLQPQNWWMVHPDEVFQSLEVANIEAFGYGFLSYEFSLPESMDNVTLHRQVELKAGMTALRSPLYPYFYVIVHSILTSLGLAWAPFHVWRVAHVIVSSFLPLAVHRHVVILTQSRDAACVAAILIASSTHLNVLGTHTLIHSFLSPINFLALSLLSETFISFQWPKCDYLIKAQRPLQSLTTTLPSPLTSSAAPQQQLASTSAANPHPPETTQKSAKDIQLTIDLNGNWSVGHSSGACATSNDDTFEEAKSLTPQLKHSTSFVSSLKDVSKTGLHDKREPCDSNVGSDVNIESDFTSKKSHPLDRSGKNYNANAAPRKNSSTNHAFQKCSISSITNPKTESLWTIPSRPTLLKLKAFLTGCLIGLTVYVRPDVSLLYAVHMVVILMSTTWNFVVTVGFIVLIGTTFGGLAGVIADNWYYGPGVVSLYNWVQFNVVNDMGTIAFGAMSSWHYVNDLFFQNTGLGLAFALAVAALIFVRVSNVLRNTAMFKDRTNSHRTLQEKVSKLWTSTVINLNVILVLVFVYSIKGHKETRLIHDTIVLILVFISLALCTAVSVIGIHSKTAKFTFITCLSVFSINQYQNFPTAQTNTHWTYRQTTDVQDTNVCLDYIRSQDDVTGIFLDADIFMSGGMTLLHHDVTVLSSTDQGFYEFETVARHNISLTEKSGSRAPTSSRSVKKFTEASNYFSGSNVGGVAVWLLMEPRFNYLLLRRDRRFVDFGFTEVLTSGNRRVLRRLGDFQSEQRLRLTAERIQSSKNISTLLHEADVLVRMGQWRHASTRLETVIELDHTRSATYPLLELAYSMLGMEQPAQTVRARCQHLFGRDFCQMQKYLKTTNE